MSRQSEEERLEQTARRLLLELEHTQKELEALRQEREQERRKANPVRKEREALTQEDTEQELLWQKLKALREENDRLDQQLRDLQRTIDQD